MLIIIATLAALLALLGYAYLTTRTNLKRYSGIADVEAFVRSTKTQAQYILSKARTDATSTTAKAATEAKVITDKAYVDAEAARRETLLEKQKRDELAAQYQPALAQYNALKGEVSLLEENLEDISFGLYKPHFSFQASEEYKANLTSIRDQIRGQLKNNAAAICDLKWTVGEQPQGR